MTTKEEIMDVSTITLRMLLEHPLDVPVLQWALFLVIMGFIVIMTYLQMRKDPLDLRWLILDNLHKPSLPKIGQLVALMISSWGFVVQVLKGTLTEEYFLFYMCAWSGSAMFEAYMSKGARASRRADDHSDYRYGSPSEERSRSNPFDTEDSGDPK